jgi:hypothetical protein
MMTGMAITIVIYDLHSVQAVTAGTVKVIELSTEKSEAENFISGFHVKVILINRSLASAFSCCFFFT